MDMPSLSSHSDDPADGGDEKQDNERIWRLLQRTDEERAEAYNVDEEWDQLAGRLDLDAADAEEGPSDTSPRRDGPTTAPPGLRAPQPVGASAGRRS